MTDGILDFLREREENMFKLLEQMVIVQSGSFNKKGVDDVGKLITEVLRAHDLSVQLIEEKEYGNHLIASSRFVEKTERRILLVGHMDTVFPENTHFRWFKEDEKHVFGPGVVDMKGGLVVGIYAMKALDSLGVLEKIPITFVFNSDEEIGSPSSRQIIESYARKSAFAIVLECGGLEGEVVTGRKGKCNLRLDVKGKAQHSASTTKEKASAVVELSYKNLGLEAMNGLGAGISVNVGKIEGGIGPNTVPEEATALIDVRFSNTHEERLIRNGVQDLIRRAHVTGTRSEVTILSERPPMEQNPANKKLFEIVEAQARHLGIGVKEEFRSGASDANLIAGQKTPVIDGLGPIGDLDHSDREYMLKESLLKRSQLLALSILEGWHLYRSGKLFSHDN